MSGHEPLHKVASDSSQNEGGSTIEEKYSPTVEQVLSVLDFEINHLVSEQQRPGWTLWAVYGGLVSAIWLVLEQWEKATIDIINVLHLFLIYSIIIDIVSDSQMLLPQHASPIKRWPRVKPYHEIQSQAEIFIKTTRACVLFLIATLISGKVSSLLTGITLFYYGATFLIGGAAFVTLFFNLPVLSPSQAWVTAKAKVVLYAIVVTVLAALIWAVTGYAESILSYYPDLVSIADFRAAGLILVISFLLSILAAHSVSTPLLTSLIEIRRDLAFGRMDLSTAIQQSDIALAGMKAEDVLQEGVNDLLKFIEQLDDEVAEVTNEIEALQTELPKNREDIKDDHKQKVRETALIFQQKLKELSGKADKMSKAIKKIRWRAGLFGDVSPESKKAAKDVIEKIEAARDRLTLKTIEMASLIFAIIEQTSEISPRVRAAKVQVDAALDELREIL